MFSEYTEEFNTLVANIDIREIEDQIVVRYLEGLNCIIYGDLSMHHIPSISECMNMTKCCSNFIQGTHIKQDLGLNHFEIIML